MIMKRSLFLLVFFSFIFLLCFRPFPAFHFYTGLDDLCYGTWAARFMLMDPQTCVGSSYPPGAGLMWFPASLFSILVGGFGSDSFLTVLPIFVGILSFLYWAISGVLFGSLLFLFAVPALYYGTHRTTMVHAPELFLSSLLIFFVLRKAAWRTLFVSVALVLLRLNDAPVMLFPLLLFWEHHKNFKIKKMKFKKWGLVFSLLFGVSSSIYLLWMGVQ